jgi:protein gp37
MGSSSNISWTDATWNPVTGCTKVSPGCKNCYAELLFTRFGQKFGHQFDQIRLHPDRLDLPLKWRKPRRVFVNSMSDLFHEEIPDTFLTRIFTVMANARDHQFQVLTKRPERMLTFMQALQWQAEIGLVNWPSPRLLGPLAYLHKTELAQIADAHHIEQPLPEFVAPNVWLGVSVENQATADERIPLLLKTPAAHRFLSVEPILERIKLPWDPPVEWVIVGGESGPHHRACEVAWISAIVEQCQLAGVKCFVKQDAHRLAGQQGHLPDHLWAMKELPD